MNTSSEFVESLLESLLRASWQATLLAGVVLLLQRLLRRWLTPSWRHALWLIVVARLLLPLAPTSAWSLFNLTPALPSRLTARPPATSPSLPRPDPARAAPLQRDTAPKSPPIHALSVPQDSVLLDAALLDSAIRPLAIGDSPPRSTAASAEPAGSGSAAGAITPGTNRDGAFWLWLALLLWASGVLLLSGRLLRSWLRFRRGLRSARPLEATVWGDLLDECRQRLRGPVSGGARLRPSHRPLHRDSARPEPRPAGFRDPRRAGNGAGPFTVYGNLRVFEVAWVHSPALCGWWRPRLLLPTGLAERLSGDELCHVLLHELAHLKRHDILGNWIATAAQVLHWFNPVVWLAMRRLRAERELAADHAALTALGEGHARSYGETILRLMSGAVRSSITSTAVGIVENLAGMRERIAAIAGFQERKGRTAAGAVLVLVLAAAGLSDAVKSETHTALARSPSGVRKSAPVSSIGAVATASDESSDPTTPQPPAPEPLRPGDRFVEVTAEMDFYDWGTRSHDPWTIRCIVGARSWRMDGDFIRGARTAYWFTGSNLVEVIESPASAEFTPISWMEDVPGEKRVHAQTRITSGIRSTITLETPDGNPGRTVRRVDALCLQARVAWLAFCSAPCLSREGRRLYPPSDLWKELVSAPNGFTDRTVLFESTLGLPERVDLYAEDRQPVLQYRTTRTTNVLSWVFPLEFHLAQYRPALNQTTRQFDTNGWELQFTARGKVTSVRPSPAPAPPPSLETARGVSRLPDSGATPDPTKPEDDVLWGTVFLDGQPLEGAWVAYRDHLRTMGGSGRTDAHGRIFVYPNPKAQKLVVWFDPFQAVLDAAQITNEFRVELGSAGGSITGTLWRGDQPWPGKELMLQRRWPGLIEPSYHPANRTNLAFRIPATTDAAGHFEFRDVPCGIWVVRSRQVEWGEFVVKPGAVLRSDPGRSGVALVGQAVAADPTLKPDWGNTHVNLMTQDRGPQPWLPGEVPSEYWYIVDQVLPPERVPATWGWLPGEIEADGSFVVPEVPPGDHVLSIILDTGRVTGADPFPVEIGASPRITVSVPPMGPNTPRVIQVGAVPLRMFPKNDASLRAPKAAESGLSNTNIVITVGREPPHFHLGTNPRTLEQLQNELIALARKNPHTPIAVRADRDCPVGKFVNLTFWR